MDDSIKEIIILSEDGMANTLNETDRMRYRLIRKHAGRLQRSEFHYGSGSSNVCTVEEERGLYYNKETRQQQIEAFFSGAPAAELPLPIEYESTIITLSEYVHWQEKLASDLIGAYHNGLLITGLYRDDRYVSTVEMIQFVTKKMEKELRKINYWEYDDLK